MLPGNSIFEKREKHYFWEERKMILKGVERIGL
jgi:hypothetical protein